MTSILSIYDFISLILHSSKTGLLFFGSSISMVKLNEAPIGFHWLFYKDNNDSIPSPSENERPEATEICFEYVEVLIKESYNSG